MAQDELAELIGMTRSPPKRAVAALVNAGAGCRDYAWIVMLNAEGLKPRGVDHG